MEVENAIEKIVKETNEYAQGVFKITYQPLGKIKRCKDVMRDSFYWEQQIKLNVHYSSGTSLVLRVKGELKSRKSTRVYWSVFSPKTDEWENTQKFEITIWGYILLLTLLQ